MLRAIVLISLLQFAVSTHVLAQEAGDLLAGVHFDMVKTDYSYIFKKMQGGAELNYFVTDKLTATTGLEYWTSDGVSFFVGTRWYPAANTFLRLRALIGANDINLGAGWSKSLNNRLRFEAVGDFYFKFNFAIRAGLVYTIPKR